MLAVGASAAGVSPALASPAADPSAVQDDTPEGRAVREAAESGKPVEVLSKRDETTQVLANPDGTFTWRQYVRPAFAKVDGDWKEADATMRKRADGRVGPAAATFGLSFSGGGDAPLATMEKAGKSLSITWPKALPEPLLSGDTATYPDVLPGVDLRIQADVDGFAQHLVVKTREAAAQPGLAELTYGLRSQGTVLKADGAGKLKVTDSEGNELFTAPTPVMWDSSHESHEVAENTATGRATQAGFRGKRSAVAAAAAGPTTTGAQDGPPSKVVEMPTKVVDNTLRISPDADFLKAPDTVFPVTIDPIFSGGGRNAWTIAYNKGGSLTGTSFWNGGGFSDKLARIGHENWTNGTARSYFRMDTDGLGGARIISATFNLLNSYSWSCAPTPVEFGWTGPISESTTWNNQPSWNETLETKSFAHGWTGDGSQCKGGEGQDFSNAALKRLVQRAADRGDANLTFGLRSRSDYENKVSSWKKFHNNPHLEVTYNRAPKVNSFAAFQGPWSPGGEDNLKVACDDDPATWPTIGRNDLTLT
ncbi:DNRLRE domain-containing protein, partial [Streptomyces sp. NPDC017529]|uniref:DNRLRE domain-containing protein n=1 Tax=Streptomyces sp. NPDC017529 TaxID=3365000 RepID=UPI0037B95113